MKCGKYGHKAADCRSKADDDEKETQNNQDCGKKSSTELVLIAVKRDI